MAEVSTFAGGCALLVTVYGMILLTDANVGWSKLVPAELISAFNDAARG
jgi:hypothetical protein